MSAKGGFFLLLGLAAAAVGTVVASAFGDDSNDEVINKKTNTPTKQTPVQLAANMSCDAALNVLKQVDPGFAGTLTKAINFGDDAASLTALALSLDTMAGAPGWSVEGRAALLRLAQCVRDRKTTVDSWSTGGAKLTEGAQQYAAPSDPDEGTYRSTPAPSRDEYRRGRG